MQSFYPLKFVPIYKERIWGGREIESKFSRSLPSDTPIGESWELSDYPGDESEVANGIYEGKTLSELISTYGTDITGALSEDNRFPLLIKILDPADKLSVQVHPDDALAKDLEGAKCGKTEMWFVLDAKKDASVICGMKKGVSADEFSQHIENKTVESILNKVPVAKNDVVFIPAKTVHAILPGMMLLEVQQTADITYRLYDWGRVDKKTGKSRDLHVVKGVKSSNLLVSKDYKKETVFADVGEGNFVANIVKSDYFCFDRIKIKDKMSFSLDGSSFYIFFGLSEKCCIKYGSSGESIEFAFGETVLVPAALRDFSVCGDNAEVACIYQEG